MATYRFYLRDGNSPEQPTAVHLHVRWNGKRLVYPTGCKVLPRHWNEETQAVTSRAPSCPHCTAPPVERTDAEPYAPKPHTEINDRLELLRSYAVEIMAAFNREHARYPERNELRDELNRKEGKAKGETPSDLFGFIRAFINGPQGKENAKRGTPLHRATVNRYPMALKLLEEYNAHRINKSKPGTVPFRQVDADFVAGFTKFLAQRKGYARNTVAKHGKTLRKFLRMAQRDPDIGKEIRPEVLNPDLYTSEEPSEQVYLNPEELAALYRLDLSGSPYLDRARDLFIVGAWTGLRFGDLSRLRPEHVEGDRIRIPTAKTGKEVRIPLHPFVREIMAKYGGGIPPAISIQKQNKYVKEVAAKVPELRAKVMAGRTVGGIRRESARPKWQLVTTHTARRSFASNCYRSGIPARTIMGVTGHTTEQAFMRYIRLTNEEHADIMAASPLFSPAILKVVGR